MASLSRPESPSGEQQYQRYMDAASDADEDLEFLEMQLAVLNPSSPDAVPQLHDNRGKPVMGLRKYESVDEAIERVKKIYQESVANVREAFAALCKGGSSASGPARLKRETATPSPSPDARAADAATVLCAPESSKAKWFSKYQQGGGIRVEPSARSIRAACYPYIGVIIDHRSLNVDVDSRYPWGIAFEAGVYGTTVTRPDVFEEYFRENLRRIVIHHRVPIYVGLSSSRIPLPFVIDRFQGSVPPESKWQLDIEFASADLSKINDDIVNGRWAGGRHIPRPLALFTAERVDFSLDRLYHYTGCNPCHFQRFILLTNYTRYMDAFAKWALERMAEDENWTEFVEPGDYVVPNPRSEATPTGTRVTSPPQMPTYHLKRADGTGITFMNIGVGPSNAKTATDHLAVLRPHCWIMVGHCAGLRRTQMLGDYVLAHAYLREDHVMNRDLPQYIPVPPISEIQTALETAIERITGQSGPKFKARVRTGTVATTDDRDWELRQEDINSRYKQSRAIAVDMESATIAANGFRFRVPYGTLLCVSDKPLHGELKLRGMANNFYAERVQQHLLCCLEATAVLRERGWDALHSRKIRGFDEPPLR
eukprot:tig00020904_g15276.t1